MHIYDVTMEFAIKSMLHCSQTDDVEGLIHFFIRHPAEMAGGQAFISKLIWSTYNTSNERKNNGSL
jgi:hypothetical protein